MGDALYTADGDRFVPGRQTTGPWDEAAQHGGPPAALLARAVEAIAAPAPLQVARLTYELLRPVPLVPLGLHTEILRPGRKVQLVQASLLAGETEVMRCTALRIRIADVVLPEAAVPAEPPVAGPDEGVATEFAEAVGAEAGFHSTACDIRFVAGGFDQPGPATAWVRLRIPVVAGEEPSAVQRAAAAADFGNGLSWVLPPAHWQFVNPDLTVHLARPPAGEWIGLRSETLPGPAGMGLAESALLDRSGRFGRGVQSLFLERRDEALPR